jgi:hypothetical protein
VGSRRAIGDASAGKLRAYRTALARIRGSADGPLIRPLRLGSAKDVSDETIADAGASLEIRWFGDSFIDLPVRR